MAKTSYLGGYHGWRTLYIYPFAAFFLVAWSGHCWAGGVTASSASLTVVSPGLVTDLARAEARLSLRNNSASAQSYDVELFVDSTQGRSSLSSLSITIPTGGQELFSSWFPTAGLGGRNSVGYHITPSGGGEALFGQRRLDVIASDTRSAPLITAAWIDPGAVLPGVYPKARPVTSLDVRNSLDAAQAVGIDTLIISYSEYVLNNWGAFYPSQSLSGPGSGGVAPFDVVGTVLDQASKNGQKVFVGLGRGNDLNLTYDGFDDPHRNAAALAHTETIATELWELYGDQPSFYGWYLSHETADIARASASYYNPAVEVLREFSADKPVLVSPSGTPIVTDDALKSSKVDVFAYQDAVGAGYVPYVYTFDPQQRIDTLHQVFSSYQAAHEGVDKHLWANLENWQMDGPVYTNAYAADSDRVLEQLDIERNYVDAISSYEWLGFMESPSSTAVLGGQAAVEAYLGYQQHYKATRPTLKSVNYVENPGFETSVGFIETPERWLASAGLASEEVGVSTDTPTGTEAALRLNLDEEDPFAWIYQDIAIAPGQEYKFSVWAKALDIGPEGGRLAAQIWMLPDSESEIILASAGLYFDSAEWVFDSTTMSAPAGASIARILFAPQDGAFGAAAGDYLIDGVSLMGAVGAPGDFDGNGEIDLADLDVWRRTFGSSLDPRADGNEDGVVDAADYTLWRDRYGSQASSAENIPVPEPGGALLTYLGAGAASILLGRRSRMATMVPFIGILVVNAACLEVAAEAPTLKFPSDLRPHDLSVSVVPPAAISPEARFEVRVALWNRTTSAIPFQIEIELESAAGEKRTLSNQQCSAAQNSQELVSVWSDAIGLEGDYKVNCLVSTESDVDLNAEAKLSVVDVPQRSVPLLQVGWIEPGAYVGGYPAKRRPDESYVRESVDRYCDLGFKSLIIGYPESIYSGGGVYYSSRLFSGYSAQADFDVVGVILNQASKNGQSVFVGLGRGTDLTLTWTGFDDELRKRAALAHSQQVATELWSQYGHEPSFYGWYLSHEANELKRAGETYYNPITQFLRTLSADKPVLISPSGTPVVSGDVLNGLEVDIIAYQDAVGVGYVPYEHTFDPERRIAQLDEVFASYAVAHESANKHLWSNLELWQMDGPEYRGAYPAAFDRVRRQIEIESQYVDVITAYALPGFIEPTVGGVQLGGPRAVKLMRDYKKYVNRVAEENSSATSN